jgi:hypothetical protein
MLIAGDGEGARRRLVVPIMVTAIGGSANLASSILVARFVLSAFGDFPWPASAGGLVLSGGVVLLAAAFRSSVSWPSRGRLLSIGMLAMACAVANMILLLIMAIAAVTVNL